MSKPRARGRPCRPAALLGAGVGPGVGTWGVVWVWCGRRAGGQAARARRRRPGARPAHAAGAPPGLWVP